MKTPIKAAIPFHQRLLPWLDTGLLFAACAGIFWLSAQSRLPTPDWFSWQDKLHHTAAYFVLGVLAWRCFRHALAKPWLCLAVSVVFCSLYGLSDEWHQSFVPGRTPSAADWIADSLGALLAALVIRWRYGLFRWKTAT